MSQGEDQPRTRSKKPCICKGEECIRPCPTIVSESAPAMDFSEMLIERVKQYRFLYDKNDKGFKNVSMKNDVWEMIAAELKQDVDTIRQKWKNLKDGYTKYKKGKSFDSKKYHHWIWGPYLSFLDGTERRRHMKPLPSTQTSEASVPSSPEPQSSSLSRTIKDETSQDMQQAYMNTEMGPTYPEKRIRYDFSEVEPKYYSESKSDEITHLFLSYGETFRKFTPRQQALLKLELAKLFADAELSELCEHNVPIVKIEVNDNPVIGV